MHVIVGAVVNGRVFEFQHLHFDGLGQSIAGKGRSFAPDEDAGIAAGLHVFPFDFQDEVLILPVGAHDADGVAAADQDAFFDLPRLFGGIDINPALQVFTVEKWPERQGFLLLSVKKRRRYAKDKYDDKRSLDCGGLDHGFLVFVSD